MICLKDLLNESPNSPSTSPSKPTTEPLTKPGTAPKPQPRRRSVPSPSTSPTPAPKAMKEQSDIMKKITDRYMASFNKLSEIDYEKIFDPETLGKLKGSVSQRTQGKNPMQVMGNLMQLSQ